MVSHFSSVWLQYYKYMCSAGEEDNPNTNPLHGVINLGVHLCRKHVTWFSSLLNKRNLRFVHFMWTQSESILIIVLLQTLEWCLISILLFCVNIEYSVLVRNDLYPTLAVLHKCVYFFIFFQARGLVPGSFPQQPSTTVSGVQTIEVCFQ